MTGVVAAFVTGPDRDDLIRLARTLVEERLVACMNIIDGVTSVYRWQSEVRADHEAMGVLKTTGELAEEVAQRVRELHPYDVPEIIFLPVTSGSRPYLDWVASALK